MNAAETSGGTSKSGHMLFTPQMTMIDRAPAVEPVFTVFDGAFILRLFTVFDGAFILFLFPLLPRENIPARLSCQ